MEMESKRVHIHTHLIQETPYNYIFTIIYSIKYVVQ